MRGLNVVNVHDFEVFGVQFWACVNNSLNTSATRVHVHMTPLEAVDLALLRDGYG